MPEQTIHAEMTNVIAKHLPMSKRIFFSTQNESKGTRAEFWASLIINADIFDTDSFGVSRDIHRVERLGRDIERLLRDAKSLDLPTQRKIRQASQLYWHDGEDVLLEALRSLTLLQKAICTAEKKSAFAKAAGNKKNWRAASVAKRCREIWGKEIVDKKLHDNGDEPPFNALAELTLPTAEMKRARARRQEYEREVDSCAPRSVHNDRPAPFGIFLEEVFATLGILSSEGEPVRAASALRALREIESKQET